MHAEKQLFPKQLMKFPPLGAPSATVPINASPSTTWLDVVTHKNILHSQICYATGCCSHAGAVTLGMVMPVYYPVGPPHFGPD